LFMRYNIVVVANKKKEDLKFISVSSGRIQFSTRCCHQHSRKTRDCVSHILPKVDSYLFTN
jgi:hypothetical protein